MLAAHRHKRARLLAPVTLVMIASVGYAHPLGNENIEHVSVLWIMPDRLEVDFLLLVAETPSMIAREEMDTNRDNRDTVGEQQAWCDKKATEFEAYLKATIDGEELGLHVVEEKVDPKTGRKTSPTKIIFKMPGFAGMPTYQLLIRYVGWYPERLGGGEHTITYGDATYTRNVGLKRITLERIPDVEVIPPHPAFWDDGPDPRMYEQYDPANLPQERSATVKFRVLGAPAGRPTTLPATRPAGRERLSEPGFPSSVKGRYQRQADRVVALLQGKWGLMMILTVTVLSFGWGAAHALMPGHAKTVVAAYLISQKGTYWHAMLLAIIVTITHTALVVILGLIVWGYQERNPALGPRLQLWLGTISGVLVAGMGVTLIWRAFTGRLVHHHRPDDHHHHDDKRSWLRKLFTHSHPHLPSHSHAHQHPHPQHEHDHALGHSHAHGHTHDHADAHRPSQDHEHVHPHVHDYAETSPPRSPSDQQLTIKLLLVLGITGGLVPCPTATIIMLLGIGANVVLGALYAVGVFSLGLALTLMLVGFLALSSRRFAARLLSDAEHEGELSGRGQRLMLQIVPTISGLAVFALGSAIAAHYVYRMQTGTALFSWLG